MTYEYKAMDEDGSTRRTGIYGPETILDLYGCDCKKFTRKSIRRFVKELCKLIDMERQDLHFHETEGTKNENGRTIPHTKRLSAVQFILTSSIVIHCVPLLGNCYINVFSCKEFESGKVKQFAWDWFGAATCRRHDIVRI